MRDIISNDTLAQIAETVDEIIVNIGDNIKNIEQPAGAIRGDTVLFTHKDYNGNVKTITVNDVRFFIKDEPLGVFDYKYSDVARHNKYVYIRIADKSGFYLEGNRNREYEPNAKMTWEQGGHSFGEDGYHGNLKREPYDNPQWSNDQYLQYCLFGLEVGKTYTFSFSAQFKLPQHEHPSNRVAADTGAFGLLFSSQEYISAELIESLPENRGTWNPTEHFQSFYNDVDTSHTYTCTFTADSSIVSESGITYLTFVFAAAAYIYSINFFWENFKTAEGIDILSKHIFWDDSWYSLGTSGGGGTSDLDAIELTYAEYQALTPAEKTDPDKIYFITDYPSGSGVVINPTGTATDTAETIEVDGTIYDFAGTDADAVHTADIGVAGGVAELDANGKVPSSQLPSYVDDVVEYASISAFPAIGESGKIYIALDTNKTYRWTGSVYVEISPSLALGETSSTAYRGDRGKTAYDHSQSDHSGIAPAFTEAGTRANIASGETFATLLGKIKKFFSDLKAVAFSGSYNDLSDTPTIPSAVAVKGNNESTYRTGNVNLTNANIGSTPYKGNLRTEIGDAAPAAATKTYWTDNIAPYEVSTAYDNKGDEYTILFSKGGDNNYGNILKWGYADKYLRILRKTSNGWLDSDWAKMDAGYADAAGKLNPYFCYYRVCALKTTLGATITGGWYRVCKVEGASLDANFIIHTSGDWNTTAPTNATVLVNTVNTSASITQLGGKLYTNMITKIRLVSVSGNIFWLDVYIGGSSSSVTRDNSQFLDLYGQVHVFEEQNPTAPYTQTVTAAASIDLKAISGNVITSEGGAITGPLTGAGAKFQGRYYGSGDDEGIIIDFCNNSYAGLCLGSPTGKRSVFYLRSDANALPFWRYNNGTGTNFDIYHPGKSGTIALTADNVASATKATQDGNGNTISSTYLKFVSNTTVTSSCTAKSCTLNDVVLANMNGLIFVRFKLTVTAIAWDTGFVLPSSVKAATIGTLAWGGGIIGATAQTIYCTITGRTVAIVKNEGYGRLDNGAQYFGWLIYY